MKIRRTVTLSSELDSALNQAAVRQGISKSSLVELLLRENKLVQKCIDDVRAEPGDGVFAGGKRSRAQTH